MGWLSFYVLWIPIGIEQYLLFEQYKEWILVMISMFVLDLMCLWIIVTEVIALCFLYDIVVCIGFQSLRGTKVQFRMFDVLK